jgi:hypothetical protein
MPPPFVPPDLCLLVVPRVPSSDATNLVRQTQDVRIFFRQAIKQAGLGPLEEVVVDDTESALIERLHLAEFAVFDANLYPSSPATPSLYYLVAVRHSLSSHNILLTRSTNGLPFAMRNRHTLTYDENGMDTFFERFVKMVGELRSGQDQAPDNPIQEYLRTRQSAEQFSQMQRQISELKDAQPAGQGQKAAPITFRKVG